VVGAETIILAVPFDAVQGIPNDLGSQQVGKVLIDVTNRFDPKDLDGASNAELIQDMLQTMEVVKAFNTLLTARQVEPIIDCIEPDDFVAGDDAQAKQKALALVESLGFGTTNAGPLAMAQALEGLALLIIALKMTNASSWQTGW
jgi:predicted dinucleotide-binding enzyme